MRIAIHCLLAPLALAFLWSSPLVAEAPPELEKELAPELQAFLENAEILATEEELEYFHSLDEDYRRHAFVEEFWSVRDPYDDTHTNEFEEAWRERSATSLVEYGDLEDARAELLLELGEPYAFCRHFRDEAEVWVYFEGDPDALFASEEAYYYYLVFQPWNGPRYRRWLRGDPYRPEKRSNPAGGTIREICRDEHIQEAMARTRPPFETPRPPGLLEIPEPPAEWVGSFAARSTVIPDDAETFDAELDMRYPGRHGQRTMAQGVVTVPASALAETPEGRRPAFSLVGDVVLDDRLFDSFRLRFEPPPADDAPLALVFQRPLRPGDYRLVLAVEDLHGRRFAGIDRRIEVPQVDSAEVGTSPADTLLGRYLAEADAATARGERSLQIMPPRGALHTGLVRVQTLASGDFDRVEFLLEGQPILTKTRPPFSVELDLGELPAPRVLRAVGYGEGDEILAEDELLLNPGGQRFRVHLTSPRSDRIYEKSLRAAVQVIAPDDETVEKVEIFLGEEKVATLFQPPFTQPILLPGERELTYVRAVAHLDDGATTEDLVFVNAPGQTESVDVHLVEIYATVRDGGRPVQDLEAGDFVVRENGVRQEPLRFEKVENLPLHATLLVDVSASMKDALPAVTEAASSFLGEVIRPKDRAAVIPFHDRPEVFAPFTADTEALGRRLAELRARGGTALYDALIYALHYFHGIQGQRALVVLSDGADESSRFELETTLEVARRAGVTVYAIGLGEDGLGRADRKVLEELARETGGRAFFPKDTSEMAPIWQTIEEDLRSQYLFAYQSPGREDGFRPVEVEVTRDGDKLEVRAMSGYYR